ncbi:MAG: hypothetical protein K8H74_18095 [Notoacmeibacter sp.]|nr:hypothetical protein [Notoacmeibacter sp.]
MKQVLVSAVALAVLSGCGTVAPNADVPQGVYFGIGKRAEIAPVDAVVIVDTGPTVQDGGRRVSGTSCKNKFWDPAPSEERAVAMMKQQAAGLGMNAIHSVEIRNEPAAVMINCWSAIVAKGIAFRHEAVAAVDPGIASPGS